MRYVLRNRLGNFPSLQVAARTSSFGNLGMWPESWDAVSRAHEKSPDNALYLNAVADYYYRTSDHAGLAALLEGNYVQAEVDFLDAAGGETGIAEAVYDEINALKYLAFVYQNLRRDDDADGLLRQCLSLVQGTLEQGWATPAIYYRTARIYALLGDVNSAISYLEKAVNKGWRIAASLEQDPLWSGMQDDPRFQNIVMAVNSDIQQQKEKVALLLDGIDD